MLNKLKFIAYGLTVVLALAFLIWLIYPEKQVLQLAPEVQITFPEGFTVKQIQERLAVRGLVFEFDENLEGYLFPDTYRFYRKSTAEQVIKKMRDNFNIKVGEISYDDLILASIVQKEVASQEDMKKVAGIFLKRLKVGMPLQSDATINFITGKNLSQPSIEDTKTVSPYNTYLNLGLPPKPICNPGLAAIEAVRFPEESAYWYFLTPSGMATIFSKTLEEHNTAKVKYLPGLTSNNKNNKIKSMKVGIVIAPKDFKDEEYFVPKEAFENAGFIVETISYKFGPALGVDGGEAKVDILAKNLKIEDYSAIIFVGGPGAQNYIEDSEAHKIAQNAVIQNKVLGAICIAPAILAKAGVLKGKQATVWSSNLDKNAIKILEQNGATYLAHNLVEDGRIVTANGPKSAQEFSQTIIKLIE